MDATSAKRAASAQNNDRSNKRTKLGAVENGKDGAKSSFAARMMAKMGYEKGQGLGREGTGIINPIEVKLRPQGAGVGAVKEKTAQAKAEAKRQAEQKGEKYEDSSEEERKARRRRKDLGTPLSSGRQTPAGRPKQKVRTVAEIEAEEGLAVPNVFKSLIDHTGQQPRLLTSTAGLMTTVAAPADGELSKIAIYARRELDAFAGSWHALQERKEYTASLIEQTRLEIEKQEAEALNMRSVADAMNAISSVGGQNSASAMTAETLDEQLEALTSSLEEIQLKFADELDRLDLTEVAVAALQSPFKKFVSLWDPLNEPLRMVPYLVRLKAILGVDRTDVTVTGIEDKYTALKPRRVATPYESLIYMLWLPKIRSLIVTEWDYTDSGPMLTLVGAWKEVLPDQVYDIIINQLIVQKLMNAVKSWRPRGSRSVKKHNVELHSWLFPWLEHLDEYHLDPRSSNGLLSEVKRKFRTAFSTWDPAKGVIIGMKEWLGVKGFRNELNHALDMHMLPALARYLHDRFDVDPSDQDITPIENVKQWSPYFSAEKFGRVFIDAFFPKWLNVLHLWLTSEPDHEEVGEWFKWWRAQLPEAVNNVAAVQEQWDAGLSMIERALELGDRVKTDLAKPKAGPRRPIVDVLPPAAKQAIKEETKPTVTEPPQIELSFRDLLEELCEEQGLMMLPLRKAHPENGMPLWRLTASAAGTGGTLFYLKGDVMYAQNRKDRSTWDLINVFEEGTLTALAEGR